MKLLRDKSFSTKILILYEIYTKTYSKLTPIADKIGVSQQAVSEYMKSLIKEKHVQKTDGKYKPTIKGIYLLQNELSELKQFIDDRIIKGPHNDPIVRQDLLTVHTRRDLAGRVGLKANHRARGPQAIHPRCPPPLKRWDKGILGLDHLDKGLCRSA